MYKALIDIGDFKKGEEVPKDIAEVWEKMYLVSPVSKSGKGIEVVEEKLVEKPKKVTSNILEDYLARNKNVVLKNIRDDNLGKQELEELYDLESNCKKRRKVLDLIDELLLEA